MRSVLKRCAESIASRPLPFMAMTLYWVWTNVAYQTPVLFHHSVSFFASFTTPSQTCALFANVVSFFVICVLYARRRLCVRKTGTIWLVCVLMAVGSAVLVVWTSWLVDTNTVAIDETASGLSGFFYLLGSAVIGGTSAMLCIEMQRVYGILGAEHMLFHGPVAMLISMMVVFAISVLPSAAGLAVFVAAPLLIAFCLTRSHREFTRRDLFERGATTEAKIPVKLLITSMLHGLSLGLLVGQPVYQLGGRTLLVIATVSYILSAILIIATAFSFRLSFNSLIYQTAFPIIAFGLFIQTVFDSTPLAGVSIQLLGFSYLHLIMWGICSHLIKHFDMSATWVVGTSTCAFMTGQLLGGLVSNQLGQSADSADLLIKMCTTACFVMLLASLLMISSRNLRTGWGLARLDAIDVLAATESGRAFALKEMSKEADLSKREHSVLLLLTQGRNRTAISDELGVSKETVKSHVKSIYRKFGVHSLQELLTLVDARVLRDGADPSGSGMKG